MPTLFYCSCWRRRSGRSSKAPSSGAAAWTNQMSWMPDRATAFWILSMSPATCSSWYSTKSSSSTTSHLYWALIASCLAARNLSSVQRSATSSCSSSLRGIAPVCGCAHFVCSFADAHACMILWLWCLDWCASLHSGVCIGAGSGTFVKDAVKPCYFSSLVSFGLAGTWICSPLSSILARCARLHQGIHRRLSYFDLTASVTLYAWLPTRLCDFFHLLTAEESG